MTEAAVEAPQRRPLDLVAAAFVVVATVAFTPLVNYEAWTPRAAVLPALAAGGIALVPPLLRAHTRRATAAALVFLALAGLSTLLSVNRTTATFGLYGWGTGLIFVAALVAAWALGVRTTGEGRELLRRVLLGGLVLNAAAATVALFVSIPNSTLTLLDGRAMGLVGNPAQFGALSAAVLALVAWARRAEPWHPEAVVGCIVGAYAVQVSGTRFAIGVIVALFAALLVWRHLRAAVAVAVLVVAGLALGTLASSVKSSSTTTERIEGAAEPGGGVAPRLEGWRIALDAATERPLLGTGPGTFKAATIEHRTPRIARLEGPDRIFADAHNLVVEYGVTTGILGLAALLAWLGLAARPARGPFLAFALAAFGMLLVQPQGVAVTPLAFLALGAATPSVTAPADGGWSLRHAVAAPAVVLAAAGAVLLFVGDYQLRQSDLDFTISQARLAERILPKWEEPASLLSRNHLFRAITEDDRDQLLEARRWRVLALRREPTDYATLLKLADLDLRLGDLDAAHRALQAALELNPVSVDTRVTLAQVELLRRDWQAALRMLREARRLGPPAAVLDDIGRLEELARERRAVLLTPG